MPSGGGDINVKQDKVNFFARGRFGMRKSLGESSSSRTNFLANDTTADLLQNSNPENNGYMGFGRAGMDYFINNRNTLTIGGTYVKGEFKTDDMIYMNRDTFYKGTLLYSDWGTRGTHNEFTFRNIGTNLSFKHNFTKPNKEWTVDANYNMSKNTNLGEYGTQFYDLSNTPKSPIANERANGGGTTKYFTGQSDFVNPISDKIKIEMGVRGAVRNFSSSTTNYIQDVNGQYVSIPKFSSDYKFTDQVYAAYGTFSHKIKDFSYQLGLRVESSKYDGTLLTTGEHFTISYPFSLFPSVYLSYKLNDKSDIQLNYSRKINRPGFFQLIPSYDYSDPLNISKGNPDLIPEFTNLAEISYQNQLTKKTSFLATAYLRNTNNLITNYQYRDPKLDSVIVSTYINANKSYNVGLEMTAKSKFTKWWDFNLNLNLYESYLQAGAATGSPSNSQFSYFAKTNNSFTLPKNFSIQLSGDYQAKTILPPSSSGGGGRGGMMFGGTQVGAQGYIKPNFGVDIAIKKDFMKNKAASLTLSMNDIFRTKKYGTYSESQYFVQDNDRRRDPQVVRLNFNYRFGKIDVSLFKKKSMKGEMESMQNAQQGGM
jgi:outer membrane receptor protein involved in Fe transport